MNPYRALTQASHWSEENYRHYIAAFQHYTKMVSKQVDSVLKALYSTPAGKNTIVVILADHGDGMTSHRMVTKHISFYDEMTNVPFIFAGPGIKHQKKPVDHLLTQPTLEKRAKTDKNLRSFFLIYFLLIISRALGPSWLG